MRNDQSTFVKKYGYLIDEFDELEDMRWSNLQYLDEYRELKMKKNDGLPIDQNRLDELESIFKNKIVTSARWNKFQNALAGMQKFIKDEVEGFVLDKQREMNDYTDNKQQEVNQSQQDMKTYADTKKQEVLDYTDTKKSEVETTVTNGESSINTTKDDALISIEKKKENIINYMDSTTAGQIRNDIGIMGESNIDGRSLIDKTNNLQNNKVDKVYVNKAVSKIEVPVTSINNKTGDVELNAIDVKNSEGKTVETKLEEQATQMAELTKKKVDKSAISSSVTSTSIINIASSKAVKTAMDKANSAFQSASDGKSAIATAITGMGQSASSSNTFATLAGKIKDISDDATASTSNVLSGKTFYQGGVKRNGIMANQGRKIITPSKANQVIPKGYHNGAGYVKGDADLAPNNIRAGKNIFGVLGTLAEGKKCATGAEDAIFMDVKESSVHGYWLKIRGMAFRPFLVVFSSFNSNNRMTWAGFIWDTNVIGPNKGVIYNGANYCDSGEILQNSPSIYDDGIEIRISYYYSEGIDGNYKWIAFGN